MFYKQIHILNSVLSGVRTLFFESKHDTEIQFSSSLIVLSYLHFFFASSVIYIFLLCSLNFMNFDTFSISYFINNSIMQLFSVCVASCFCYSPQRCPPLITLQLN
ncbi:hypothetical protein GYH30_015059 [Glycine max]|uniref:Uncharacterized protein n=1 Tax=Glycine max TaxID=3847 RepID=A0A0R0JH21_SOYBN|nr:hypothetical protein GYH30_015059 [Glycine max]